MTTDLPTSNAERLIAELDFPLREYAEWRRTKAVQHPEDARNLRAAEMAERIADTLNDIPRDALLRLEPHTLWDDCDRCDLLDEAEESIKTLGFHWGAKSATDFIDILIPETVTEPREMKESV